MHAVIATIGWIKRSLQFKNQIKKKRFRESLRGSQRVLILKSTIFEECKVTSWQLSWHNTSRDSGWKNTKTPEQLYTNWKMCLQRKALWEGVQVYSNTMTHKETNIPLLLVGLAVSMTTADPRHTLSWLKKSVARFAFSQSRWKAGKEMAETNLDLPNFACCQVASSASCNQTHIQFHHNFYPFITPS